MLPRNLKPTFFLAITLIAVAFATTASAAQVLLMQTAAKPAGEALAVAEFAKKSGVEVASGELTKLLAAKPKVLWLHEGDQQALPASLTDKKSLEALKKYVENGGTLFLSGTTLQLVHLLGIEPSKPRLGKSGNDSGSATLTPRVKTHPIFRGATLGNGGKRLLLSDKGYPAFADFHGSGGPKGGMLLATAPGAENPLVEYSLGKGRVLVMGWRLPHYGNKTNKHRDQLEALTKNILTYLATSKNWVAIKAGKVGPIQMVKKATSTPPPAPTGDPTDAEKESLRLAIVDLATSFPKEYTQSAKFLARLEKTSTRNEFETLKKEALLANPLLDFDSLILIDRAAKDRILPSNWQSNSSLKKTGHDNAIRVLSPVSPDGKLTTLYKPTEGRAITDLDLNFDAKKLLFSMAGKNGSWQLHELEIPKAATENVSTPQEVTTIPDQDVDNYDACYGPDGSLYFTSTATQLGVPCVRGSSYITNLYKKRPDGKVERLTVDQEHNWCPEMMPNGRVMYQRWEYTDTPHAFYRLMFEMNPDGTSQRSLYGTNSYWPNAMFYSRPIPGNASKFVTIVGGHHDLKREGQLVIFDTSKGRHEADGVVQRIPGRGEKVEPIILDGLTQRKYPRFLHPYPLSEKYFLVSCQPTSNVPRGIYLVDIFDNFLRLCDAPGRSMMEPFPLRRRPKPPIIPSHVIEGEKNATVVMSDVYVGPGLAGIPRGAVKKLRVTSYNFSLRKMGGQIDRVGFDGPWDVRVILGTVPVETDGSANFTVPAMLPIAVQPLDAEGKALQYMRSWFTCRPGEILSCVGCHEEAGTAPPSQRAIAAQRAPSPIKPWYGPMRGFSFNREVQPVLDKFCVGCHNGETKRVDRTGKKIADLTQRPDIHPNAANANYNNGAHFSPAYMELKRYVRNATMESDAHLLTPCDFHADQTDLVQLLMRGHHGVKLDEEGWDRLITWIDLNTPAHGTWREVVGAAKSDTHYARRKALMETYAGISYDPEDSVATAETNEKIEFVKPEEPSQLRQIPKPINDPEVLAKFDEPLPKEPQTKELELAEGVTLKLVRVPAGTVTLGNPNSYYPDEWDGETVKITKPFWVGQFEVTNEQYAAFNPKHSSRLEHGEFLQFSIKERGHPLDAPQQPVVRISQEEAKAFCKWLSKKANVKCSLPTEAQWVAAAARGGLPSNKEANLADAVYTSVEKLGWGLPIGAISQWRPADDTVSDGHRISAPVGTFPANAAGIYDLRGNVAEWTRDLWRKGDDRALVKGGSWRSVPYRARATSRVGYKPFQKVVDVGFRVVVEE